uniref:Uncharacterized protein n=1 Tax=Strigamia maritima TaxID=126957 RepID=T1J5S1_STRMM
MKDILKRDLRRLPLLILITDAEHAHIAVRALPGSFVGMLVAVQSCCFVTFFTRKASLEAQNMLHNMKTMPGIGDGSKFLSLHSKIEKEEGGDRFQKCLPLPCTADMTWRSSKTRSSSCGAIWNEAMSFCTYWYIVQDGLDFCYRTVYMSFSSRMIIKDLASVTAVFDCNSESSICYTLAITSAEAPILMVE